jgi:moderate conductance mechanosensitive channel
MISMPNREQLQSLDYYLPFAFNIARIGAIVVFAYVTTLILARFIRVLLDYSLKAMQRAGEGADLEREKRASTVFAIGRKVCAAIIWGIALIMILKEMNFDIRPLLAGAGVVGVALGFGAQNIVKDGLAGFFLLVENQIRVNDVATINGKSGVVEEINLRTTVLRAEDGAVHIFPNGTIQTLANLSRGYSYAVFALQVAYKEDPDRVLETLKSIADELMQDDRYRLVILAPIEIGGLDQFKEYAIVVKARLKTLPGQQGTVANEMNRRIKKRFEEVHIEVPYPTQTVHLDSTITEEMRTELKQLVREALAEKG